MQASAVQHVIAGLNAVGVSVVCYLPDSLLKELYPALDADPDICTIRVTNEGEGAAICDVKRKHSDGREDKYIFVRHVEQTENIVIMGPSDHN